MVNRVQLGHLSRLHLVGHVMSLVSWATFHYIFPEVVLSGSRDSRVVPNILGVFRCPVGQEVDVEATICMFFW